MLVDPCPTALFNLHDPHGDNYGMEELLYQGNTTMTGLTWVPGLNGPGKGRSWTQAEVAATW